MFGFKKKTRDAPNIIWKYSYRQRDNIMQTIPTARSIFGNRKRLISICAYQEFQSSKAALLLPLRLLFTFDFVNILNFKPFCIQMTSWIKAMFKAIGQKFSLFSR